MIFMAIWFLATIGVPLSLLVWLVLLAIPRLRQLSPYAFFLYPAVYTVGLFSFWIVGMLGSLLMPRYRAEEETIAALIAALGSHVVLAIVAFGAAALGSFAGLIGGIAIANRLWWRFFANHEDKATYPEPRGWLAMPPIIFRRLNSFSMRLRAAWKGWQSAGST